MDPTQEFFVVDGAGQQQGPLTAEQLKEYWEANYVNETTNVYAPDIGMDGWTPIGDVPALAPWTGAAPAPAAASIAPERDSSWWTA